MGHLVGDVLAVFVGGGAGAVLRFGIGRAALRLFGAEFPWGILAVNALGCFLVGLVVGAIDFGLVPPRARPLLVTGFLGGLTTFSTYAWGLFELARRGQWGRGLFHFGLENAVGVGLVLLGFWLAESIKN